MNAPLTALCSIACYQRLMSSNEISAGGVRAGDIAIAKGVGVQILILKSSELEHIQLFLFYLDYLLAQFDWIFFFFFCA